MENTSKNTSDQMRVRSANSSSRNSKTKQTSAESKGSKKKAINQPRKSPSVAASMAMAPNAALETIPEAPSNPSSTAGSSLTTRAPEGSRESSSTRPDPIYPSGLNQQRRQWQVQSSSTSFTNQAIDELTSRNEVQGTYSGEREVVWELEASRYNIGKIIGSGSLRSLYTYNITYISLSIR
jgi:hypothetical protein